MYKWVDLYGAAFEGRPLKDQLKSWLLDEPWSKEKYDEYQVLNQIPVVSNYMDYLLSVRADEEYLARYQMDYSDIHDPRKLSQTSAAASLAGSARVTTSRNIDRLYQNFKPVKKKK